MNEAPGPIPSSAPLPAGNAGCYVLVLSLKKSTRISVGSLGEIDFPRGHFLYVGRARRNLRQRIARHLRADIRIRWHIDYLRQAVEVVDVLVTANLEECALAGKTARLPRAEIVPRFGAGDCRCPGHLIRFDRPPDLRSLGLQALGIGHAAK